MSGVVVSILTTGCIDCGENVIHPARIENMVNCVGDLEGCMVYAWPKSRHFILYRGDYVIAACRKIEFLADIVEDFKSMLEENQ